MKQSRCIEDPAGFAEGGDAGGQAGGKARSTEAYRLHRGPLFSKKITPPKDWVMKSSNIPPPRSQSEAAIYRSAYSGFCWIPPCSAASV
jgi:hypothetical protein